MVAAAAETACASAAAVPDVAVTTSTEPLLPVVTAVTTAMWLVGWLGAPGGSKSHRCGWKFSARPPVRKPNRSRPELAPHIFLVLA